MKKIFAVVAFAALTMLGTTAVAGAYARSQTGTPTGGAPTGGVPAPQPGAETQEATKARRQVSEEQYRILTGQCRYAETQKAREQCRTDVAQHYSVGKHDPTLDCRTYSGVTVCGELKLSAREQACVQESVHGGLTHRRAEVECYAFR